MATHSRILAWEIPWTEELGGLQFRGLQRDCLSSTVQSFLLCSFSYWASLVAQMIKHLPAMQEAWVQFLGGEDPLEK